MEDIKDLLVKYITNAATPEETARAEAWIDQDPANREEYLHLEQTWRDAGLAASPGALDPEQALEKLREQLGWTVDANPQGAPVTRLRRLPILRAAAITTGILLLGGILYYKANHRQPENNPDHTLASITVPRGQKKHLYLPDSTEVWLNAGSTLNMEAGFGSLHRNVSLTGEGFFRVRHNAGLVFTVTTPQYTIRDIGTAFNINTYPGDTHFEAAVLEGEISVEGFFSKSKNDKPSRIILSRNQVLKIHGPAHDSLAQASAGPQPANAADSAEPIVSLSRTQHIGSYAGWKDDQLSFDNECFRDIANRLERQYDINIKIEDAGLANFHYTGSFRGLEGIDAVLSILQETTPFTWERKNDTVYMKSR